MAMNHHFAPDKHPVWWANHNHRHPPPAAMEAVMETAEKEHMFEKTLTPSDVGKLNRLVIPKQHAEKYFPIGGGVGSGSGVDSGLLLSFEDDETAKCWKFRYSYWNSSQSYVLTKGWSRYVKEKGLDAGDVVVFGRLRADTDHMFIGCRRRVRRAAAAATESGGGGNGGGGGEWSSVVRYPAQGSYPSPSTHPYQPDCLYAGSIATSQMTPNNGNSKILRLFGVNLEYHPNASDDDVAESMSHSGPTVSSPTQSNYQHYYPRGHDAYPQSYMEYNLSGDANQMRYQQG